MPASQIPSGFRRHIVAHQTTLILLVGLLAAPLTFSLNPAHAARVSEPPTVLYGQVVFRGAGQPLVLRDGSLELTLRGSVPSPWERRFRTRLESLGQGRFSYRLSLPHDLLAYNLETAASSVPLAAGPASLEQASMTLDGLPLTIVDPGVRFFAVQQKERASTRRVDWDASRVLTDTDGDGLPDAWEDRNGYDRWNPADGAAFFRPGGEGTDLEGSGNGSQTFAQWRAAHFPGDQRDLDVFAAEDADGDGISNLVEYAFGLNPTDASDLGGMDRLPQGRTIGGRFTVVFERHAPETEVEYRVEVSSDLMNWEPSSSVLAAPAAAIGGAPSSKQALMTERPDAPESNSRFVRMQILRRR